MQPDLRIHLAAPVSIWGADEYDLRRVKTALNHLGYYTPAPRTGIDEFRDPALFKALERFRADHNLPQSPWLMPRDETVEALNDLTRENRNLGRYIWRTVGDERVRDEHGARAGQIFRWGDPPPGGHPGQDYNCRCWVEVVVEPVPARKPVRYVSGEPSITPEQFKKRGYTI